MTYVSQNLTKPHVSCSFSSNLKIMEPKKAYFGKKEFDIEPFWKKSNYCPIKWFNYKSMHSTTTIKILYLFGLPVYRNTYINLNNSSVISFYEDD
jgi:hypothetical protein